MPYLQVDIDAMDSFEDVAVAAEIPPGDVYRGALKLWRHCWKTKTTHVSRERLATFFPGDQDRVVAAMVACEFLDLPSGSPDFHVRGSEKRLGVAAKQSAAGKARASGPRDEKGRLTPGGAGGELGVSPALVQPESSSYIQHPTSSIQQLETLRADEARPPLDPIRAVGSLSIPALEAEAKPEKRTKPRKVKAPEEPPAPGWPDLVDRLFLVFEEARGCKPSPSDRDWKALKKLRTRTGNNDAEVIARFGRGLRSQFKAKVDSFWDLNERWDALTGADPPNRAGNAREADIRRGTVRAEDQKGKHTGGFDF